MRIPDPPVPVPFKPGRTHLERTLKSNRTAQCVVIKFLRRRIPLGVRAARDRTTLQGSEDVSSTHPAPQTDS